MTTGPNLGTIFVVDDDQYLRRILTMVLEREGYRIHAAASAVEALPLIGREAPNLIISDVEMPEMDGFELRRRLSEDPETKNIPFIFLTGRSESDDQVHGLDLGAQDYITKPFEPPVLIARVRAVLRRVKAAALQARADSLTGLLNRQTLEEAVASELKRESRGNHSAALVFLDIDDFKKINDTHGHAVGDRVLKTLAGVLSAGTRESDIAGRYGGEEFVVLFADSDARAALGRMNDLMRLFGEACGEAAGFSASFSAGIAEAPRHGKDFATLSQNADMAMYQAKRAGKARVTIWGEKE
ncbi:MAG: diguanylate cyclase [Deltaproteobacteria bacterium]|nr:diguanylate cyclase [Deltaproteobacteria bacterium]